MIRALIYCNAEKNLSMKIIAAVRSKEKAQGLFAKELSDGAPLSFIEGTVEDLNINNIAWEIDYIIHMASQTSSKAFVEKPVEVINTSIFGTINMLNLAKAKNAKGLLYLSSMEVYGNPETDELIKENHGTNLDVLSPQTCYPESKRMCESICCTYCSEYDVPAKIIRLTQTFGPGVTYNDSRVFAEFARCAIEKRDIVLHTKGETKRMYLYTADAVKAILTVLLKGESGQAYNAANKETYCSIYEMAQLVAKECAEEAKQLRDQLLELCEIEEGNTILRLKGSAPADENIRQGVAKTGIFLY